MKLIRNWIKVQEQKSKLDLISELLVSGTVEENIELFNKVKSQFHLELDLYKHKKENEINLINRIRPIKQYDSNYDKTLNEIETDFELVNAS